ncbi:MAG: chromate transporter [Candidatus Izemoplasmataceae bacterium]
MPGVLLIYFVLLVWEQLKAIKGLKITLKGITVVAAGLIASAGIVLMRESGLSLENFIVVIVTITLLLSKKVPAPIIVVLALLAGALI